MLFFAKEDWMKYYIRRRASILKKKSMAKLTGRALSRALDVPVLITEEDLKEDSCVSANVSDKETINWKNVKKGVEDLPSVEEELETLK